MKRLTLLALALTIGAVSFAQIEGSWKIYEGEGGLWVGPGEAYGETTWWQTDPTVVGERPCYFDDLYVFNADGSFENVLGDETWLEEWQSGEENAMCGAPVAPHDGSADAQWLLSGSELIITGKGAYIGLPKAFNGGEISDPNDAPDEIIYTVESHEDDVLILSVQINDDPAFWAYTLVKADAADDNGDDVGTSVESLTVNANLSLFPSIAENVVTLKSEQVISAVNIYNSVGQLVISEAVGSMSAEFNVNNLSNGVYIVRAQFIDGKATSQRFIKK